MAIAISFPAPMLQQPMDMEIRGIGFQPVNQE
jgi:hypothetical protein